MQRPRDQATGLGTRGREFGKTKRGRRRGGRDEWGLSGGYLAVPFSVQADFEEVPFALMSEGGKMEVLYIFFILLHGCETGGKYVWFCMISDKN